ncbi:MAG: GNAT family N-acetyltransferase [Spirosomataceae bacterium]
MTTPPLFNLRRWQKGDEAALVKYANDYQIWRNVRDVFPHPYTSADAHQWIKMCEAEHLPTVFAIEVNNEAVGAVGITLQKDVFRKNAEIGYWLGAPFWGQGIMSEAVREMSDYAFRQFDIHRLYAGVFEYNKASMRVLEKAGFTFEAVLHQAICKEDKIWDDYIFSKLK